MMAAAFGHNETVKTLIAADADVSLKVRIYYCLTTHLDRYTSNEVSYTAYVYKYKHQFQKKSKRK